MNNKFTLAPKLLTLINEVHKMIKSKNGFNIPIKY